MSSHLVVSGVFVAGIATGAIVVTLIQPYLDLDPGSADRPPVAAGSAAPSQDMAVAPSRRAPPPPGRSIAVGTPSQGDNPMVGNPPPHVMDPAFFESPTVDQAQAERLRQEALQEFVQSMRTAGMPEADIAAVVAQTSQVSMSPDPVSEDDPYAVAPTVDDEANALAASMRAAGVPEAVVTEMAENLYQLHEVREASEAGPEPDPVADPMTR